MASTLTRDDVQQVLWRQAGVISRRQFLERSGDDNDLRRMVRRRELTRALPGVYVNHTGPLLWNQRAWAGVLYYWPAALCGDSAMLSILGERWRRGGDHIQIAVDVRRDLAPQRGYQIYRMAHLAQRTHMNFRPPRIAVEDAVLALAASSPTSEAIAVLADACQARCTSPAELLQHAMNMPRLPGRSWLTGMLSDLAEGTSSTLELAYLRDVEQAHCLPRPERQVRAHAGARTVRRDVLYRRYALAVELDGRAFHDHARARDADLDRDLSAALEGVRTVRLGWSQVVSNPCQTAGMISALLRQGGWSDAPQQCSPQCTLDMLAT